MARPKPMFESRMIRVPGELVAPVRSLIAGYHVQQRKIMLAKREALKKAKTDKQKEKPDDNG